MKLVKDSSESIITTIEKEVVDKDKKYIKELQEFYFKIVVEDTIRTSSYRYVYAKAALEFLSNQLGDSDTLKNLIDFHSVKYKNELANPYFNLKKDDEEKALKRNPATPEQKRMARSNNTAIQTDFKK